MAIQGGIVVVSIILLFSFYVFMALDLLQGKQALITPLILIIIAIELLAIFWELIVIEGCLKPKRGRK